MQQRLTSFLLGLVCLPIVTMAQTGRVMDNLSMTSKILKMERKYAVYLPPDYESSERSYPVLYLLHGGGDDQTAGYNSGKCSILLTKRSGKAMQRPW